MARGHGLVGVRSRSGSRRVERRQRVGVLLARAPKVLHVATALEHAPGLRNHSPTHPSMNTSVFNIKRERGCEEKAPARAQESRFGGRSETPPETPSGPLENKPMPAKVTVHRGA